MQQSSEPGDKQEASSVRQPAVANRAIAFILLVCVLFIVADIVQVGLARKEHIEDARRNLENMARALQRHADDAIKSADTSLIGMVRLVEAEGYGQEAQDRLAVLMSQSATELEQVHAYFAYDELGHPVLDSTPLFAPQDVEDREYFRYHLTNDSRAAHIGPLIKTRTTGAWSITVSRRINRHDGSFGGVIVAALDLEYFKKFYDTFGIGKAGVMFLGLNKGTTLVRRPLYEQYVGTSLIDIPIFRDHIARNNAGLAMFNSVVDGKERLAAYQHLQHYPLFVFVAQSKDEILSGWVETTIIHGCGLGLLLLAVLLLGSRLVRQIRLRARTEGSLLQARDSLSELNATLQRLALEDALTGLANRRHFDLALQEELGRAAREGRSLALVMIDVDRFKQYNDIYGHAAGDDCLRRIGEALKTVPRRTGDLAARYGGEEMALLLPGADAAAALAIAEHLREKIDKLNIAHAGNPAGNVTVSAGVDALTPARPGNTPEELIQRADQALYQAKHSGRNQVCSSVDVT